jgi:hypothetical protein
MTNGKCSLVFALRILGAKRNVSGLSALAHLSLSQLSGLARRIPSGLAHRAIERASVQ